MGGAAPGSQGLPGALGVTPQVNGVPAQDVVVGGGLGDLTSGEAHPPELPDRGQAVGVDR